MSTPQFVAAGLRFVAPLVVMRDLDDPNEGWGDDGQQIAGTGDAPALALCSSLQHPIVVGNPVGICLTHSPITLVTGGLKATGDLP